MRRRGFTLIELLVVMGIIAALATMIIVLAPAFGDRQRASRGASMLQSWINLAKQRAIRDRRPVGIRLPTIVGASSNQTAPFQFASAYVREVTYIEIPDEGVGGTITVPFPAANPDYHYIQLTTTVGFTPNTPTALIQTGDVFNFLDRPMGAYLPRRVTPTNPPPAADDSVVLASSSPPYFTYQVRLDVALPTAPMFATPSFSVSRRARPVVGESVLQLPKDIAIDISRDSSNPQGWYRMFPQTANTGGNYPFDILFSPSGQVIGNEGNLGSRMCLWVRDVSLNAPSAAFNNDPTISDPSQMPPGYNALITIYTRTGHVTSHPIDPTGLVIPPNGTWNPFRFTQDGLTSGNAGN